MMPRFAGLFLLLATFGFPADQAVRDQVNQLLQHRQFAEAQAILEKVVAAEPANAEAYFHLGRTQIARGDHEHAVASFETATNLEPANSEYFRLLGDAYGITAQKAGLFAKFGWAKKCKAAYEKSVELDRQNVDARWSVMEYCRLAAGVVGGSFIGGSMEGAYAQAAEIKQIDPDRGRLAYAILYSSEKKYPEAFQVYDEALRASPDDYNSLYQLGRLAADSGQNLDRGLAALRHCLELEPPPRAPGRAPTHWRIGIILAKKGDPAGARAAYEAAVQADPNFPPAREALRKLK